MNDSIQSRFQCFEFSLPRIETIYGWADPTIRCGPIHGDGPHRVRTWAPRGQTPVLQLAFNWKRLSVIARITTWTLYFRLYPGTITGPQIVDFWRHLQRQMPRKPLIIWDGLSAHRIRAVQQYVETCNGAIRLAFLPAYVPELNRAEHIWGYCKEHELSNFCPDDVGHFGYFARNRLRTAWNVAGSW